MGSRPISKRQKVPLEEEARLRRESEALKKEVLVFIDKDSLKNDILKELKGADSKFGKVAQHPAILLVLSFIFTTGLGAWLTSRWQRSEWDRQQVFLAQQRNLDQKRATADEVTKAIAETATAADDVLALFVWDDGEPRAVKESWRQSSRNWRISSKTLLPKLVAYFRNPEARSLFDQINSNRTLIGNKIRNLLDDYTKYKRETLAKLDRERVEEDRKSTLDKINEVRDLLGQLIDIMVKEIREDGQPQPLNISFGG